MLTVRKAKERGHFDHGWLDTYHTFSFADYHDPRWMGFRSLRVMNEDRIEPGRGFGMHPHRDMEIITYVLSGALTHRDSLGTESVLSAGELQRMTAGTGIWHSEFNGSETESVHLYQVWLLPGRRGLEPGYEQRAFGTAEHPGKFRVVVAPDGRDGALTIQQDATLSLANLEAGSTVSQPLAPGRNAWLQVLRGRVAIDGQSLAAGDGAGLGTEPGQAATVTVRAEEASEVLLFDLA